MDRPTEHAAVVGARRPASGGGRRASAGPAAGRRLRCPSRGARGPGRPSTVVQGDRGGRARPRRHRDQLAAGRCVEPGQVRAEGVAVHGGRTAGGRQSGGHEPRDGHRRPDRPAGVYPGGVGRGDSASRRRSAAATRDGRSRAAVGRRAVQRGPLGPPIRPVRRRGRSGQDSQPGNGARICPSGRRLRSPCGERSPEARSSRGCPTTLTPTLSQGERGFFNGDSACSTVPEPNCQGPAGQQLSDCRLSLRESGVLSRSERRRRLRVNPSWSRRWRWRGFSSPVARGRFRRG